MTQERPRFLQFTRSVARALFGAVLISAPSAWAGALTVQGKVFDTNGNTLKQVAVTLTRSSNVAGPFASTVFSREDGSFAFAPLAEGGDPGAVTVEARAVGYRQVAPVMGPAKLADVSTTTSDVKLVLVLQPQLNHADTAPPSAWLKQIPQSEPMKPLLVKTCVNCHVFPQPEAMNFMRSMSNASASASATEERKANWLTMTKFMYYGFVLSMIDSGKSGSTGAPHPDLDMEKVLSDPGVTRHFEPVSELLARYMLPQHLDRVTYDYGAPSVATPRTTIHEYTIPSPEFASTIHSAALFGDPMKLWVPDLSRGQIYLIDPLTGKSNTVKVPVVGQPGVLSYAPDGTMYVGFTVSNILGTVGPQDTHLTITTAKKPDGTEFEPLFMADMALGADRLVHKDNNGRIWFVEANNNGLVGMDPVTGEAGLYPSGRMPPGSSLVDTDMYAAVMTSDRKHVWYAQLGNNFGSFNTETLQYEEEVQLPANVGPRRLAITEKDVLYVPLFGTGQIMEYDTRTRKQTALYDLPDRAAGPYVVAWDQRRQVLWIGTSNAGAIYRFDPKTKSFGVIPLPQRTGYLRQMWIEPQTGLLNTAYAPLPKRSPGARLALTIDPGDEAAPAVPSSIKAALPKSASLLGKPASASGTKTPQGTTTATALKALLDRGECDACHSLNQARIGPPIMAINLRYSQRPREETAEFLAAKILYGGGGNWGSLPMIANSHRIDRAQARELARAILDLRLDTIPKPAEQTQRDEKKKERIGAH